MRLLSTFAMILAGLLWLAVLSLTSPLLADESKSLKLLWEKSRLTISGEQVPGKEIKILYLEAYCRAGSTDREWGQTVIPHKTEMISAADDGRQIKLKCTVSDGVIVCVHSDFRIGGLNPDETMKIRGKLYVVKSDIDELLKRYERDFPEHVAKK